MLNILGARWQAAAQPLFAKLGSQLNQLDAGLTAQAVALNSAQWSDLCAYLDLLVTWNKKLDLTAASSTDELLDLVLSDAVVLAQFVAVKAQCIDVGAGAGAPGAALAILRSDLAVTLVEPMQKRVAFLRALTGSLHSARLQVVRARSDGLPSQGCDVALSRATFEPSEWLREGSRLATREVWLLLARSEAPQWPGWALELDVPYQWPLGGAPRRALKYVRKIP
ncbi:MAG TPA: RsmG family class I SAM-dependent methyltransferase [Polyangiaceae bacterium]|nr:RsmG family class I SAM-dependent methyltransferase [Polyangiaceae bacterium]